MEVLLEAALLEAVPLVGSAVLEVALLEVEVPVEAGKRKVKGDVKSPFFILRPLLYQISLQSCLQVDALQCPLC